MAVTVTEEKLGRYIVREELGRGGMGVVYRGFDPVAGAEVALKVLPTQLALDQDFYLRFRREINVLRQLDHPGIVRVIEEGEQDGALYYAMEYVSGVALDKLIAKGPIEAARATDIALQCARILEYAHAHGVIHRDIKPANIMIQKSDAVKLTDFGIAKLAGATHVSGLARVLGTVEYMSPEQAEGHLGDPRSDLYSLGVVYCQMVTGRLPITGRESADTAIKSRAREVAPPRELVPDPPARINDVIVKLLARDPADRVQNAKALARELELALESLRSPRPPENFRDEKTSRERAPDKRRRKRRWPWMGLLSGFAGLCFGGTPGDVVAVDNARQRIAKIDMMLPEGNRTADWADASLAGAVGKEEIS